VGVFDGLKTRFDRLFAEASAGDPRARAAALRDALVEAKVGVATMRDALAASERELAAERKQLENAERRGRLAAQVPDPETVAVAERFAARHRARIAVLERKLPVQRDELALAERDVAEMAAQLRDARFGGERAAANAEAAWRDVAAAGGARPGADPEGDLLRAEADRAAHAAAVDAQLAYLKKKLGKE
jgi:hypothetical protein